VFTIALRDGNRFLARGDGQSIRASRTQLFATFVQQFDRKPAKLRKSARGILATPEQSRAVREFRQASSASLQSLFLQLFYAAQVDPGNRDSRMLFNVR
jgi:hypothetical protein